VPPRPSVKYPPPQSYRPQALTALAVLELRLVLAVLELRNDSNYDSNSQTTRATILYESIGYVSSVSAVCSTELGVTSCSISLPVLSEAARTTVTELFTSNCCLAPYILEHSRSARHL
jgi:hypothetical protein